MDEDVRHQRLPQSFSVRELGSTEARGLWGIKHTRKPVDLMVAAAKTSSTPLSPLVELRITEDGCEVVGKKFKKVFPIHTVSYGVQVRVTPCVYSVYNERLLQWLLVFTYYVVTSRRGHSWLVIRCVMCTYCAGGKCPMSGLRSRARTCINVIETQNR